MKGFSFQVELLVQMTSVTVINSKGRSIRAIQRYGLAFSFTNAWDVLSLVIVAFLVLGSDDCLFSTAEKAWLVLACYLLRLIWDDLNVQSSRFFLRKAHLPPSSPAPKSVAPTRCSIDISTVKLVDAPCDQDESILFCIRIEGDKRRWEVWRTYRAATDVSTSIGPFLTFATNDFPRAYIRHIENLLQHILASKYRHWSHMKK